MARIMAVDPVYEVQRPSKRNYVFVDAGSWAKSSNSVETSKQREEYRNPHSSIDARYISLPGTWRRVQGMERILLS